MQATALRSAACLTTNAHFVSCSRAAHSLKSNSANLGATTLSGLAKELEMIARAGTLDGAAERLPRVEAETEQARAALEQMKK